MDFLAIETRSSGLKRAHHAAQITVQARKKSPATNDRGLLRGAPELANLAPFTSRIDFFMLHERRFDVASDVPEERLRRHRNS